jgi:hypothetical protein
MEDMTQPAPNLARPAPSTVDLNQRIGNLVELNLFFVRIPGNFQNFRDTAISTSV